MKAFIHYIDNYLPSISQSKQALNSFNFFSGWEAELIEGFTPRTLSEVPPIKEESRLLDFKKNNENQYLTKVSCAMNHVRFWKKVIDLNEPCAFIEHDAICISSWKNYDFDEYLIMNADYVFRPPNKLGKQKYKDFHFPQTKDPADIPNDYPLQYYRENDWKGSNMAPGTASYAITPKGAKKMLSVASNMLDQSDFMINSHNIRMQYITLFKFNTINLSSSNGI
jgi:GR25 family glycosyltransferase involved in LPS biosynthesis